MISAGLQLMLLGMGIVFLFLIVLVALMGLMSRVVRWIEARTLPHAETAGSDHAAEAARMTAVLAAVSTHHHRKRGSQ